MTKKFTHLILRDGKPVGAVIFKDEINKKGEKMRNDNYVTELNSYNENRCVVVSKVSISCKEYDTFKKIVEAVTPILEAEDEQVNS